MEKKDPESRPLFRLGQRVYSRANPIHGKVMARYRLDGESGYTYSVKLDRPNPLNIDRLEIAEAGLRATLEETLEWRAAEKRDLKWLCPGCDSVNDGVRLTCARCGFPTIKR